MRKLLSFLVLLPVAVMLGGCPDENVADQRERQATAQLTAQASTQVGMPGIIRFTEKRNLKMLYELRDDPKLTTIAYIVDLNGKLHKVCDALGYGFPYATQFTNPQRDTYYSGGDGSSGTAVHFQMPQPEPNGLFMPNAADGTWVMCLDPQSKDVKPVYIEPRVIVSPFPLKVE
jgi:hypothetical protein